MEKGKWHKVNGKLVRKRNRRAVVESLNGGPIKDSPTPEQLLNRWWNRLSLSEKLSKALEEE